MKSLSLAMLLTVAMAGGLAFSQDDTETAPKAKPTKEELKAERIKKQGEKLKIKWYNTEKEAFDEAKKYNLPVWVLYSNPATCGMCRALDANIINSRQLKREKGLFIGYRSTSPIPKYNCNKGMPTGAVVSPEGKHLCNLSYNPNMKPEEYIQKLQDSRDTVKREANVAETKKELGM